MIISIILVSLYIIYTVYKNGIPHSLSATYYSLTNKCVFSLVLILSIIFSFNEFMTPEKWQFLPFIFLSGILFVAFAPDFESNELTEKVHVGAAIVSLIASQIWVAIVRPQNLSLWVFFLIYLFINRKKKISETNYKFWAEIIMLLTLLDYNKIFGC